MPETEVETASQTVAQEVVAEVERDFALELVRVVEIAAIAAARSMGQGDPQASDHTAVEAMRTEFEKIPMAGRIVIGEGERDKAPMLYIGEKIGGAAPRTASITPGSTLPLILSKAPTFVPREPKAPWPCSRPRNVEVCCTLPTATWKRSLPGPPAAAPLISMHRWKKTCVPSPSAWTVT